MLEQDINSIIDSKSLAFNQNIKIEKLQYIMDFGEVSVQYDFCLN